MCVYNEGERGGVLIPLLFIHNITLFMLTMLCVFTMKEKRGRSVDGSPSTIIHNITLFMLTMLCVFTMKEKEGGVLIPLLSSFII